MVSKVIVMYLFSLGVVALGYAVGFLFFYGLANLIIIVTNATINSFVLATFIGMSFLAIRTTSRILINVAKDLEAQASKNKENK